MAAESIKTGPVNMKAIFIFLAAVLGGSCFVQAAEFTLEYKRLSQVEAQACPGGYGMSGSIQKSLQRRIKVEPKAVSAFALYGAFYRRDGKNLDFRLDETKGNRRGFDQLIIDLNRNADLTDDVVINKGNLAARLPDPNREQVIFGPVEAPAPQSVGPWRPVFYAELYLYNRTQMYAGMGGTDYAGSLRCYPGWILETTVEVDGVREKIAFKDGNCNFRLGDPSSVSKIMRRPNEPGRWYLSVEDYVLRDRNHNGQFERSPVTEESEGLSSLIYFGAKPFNLVLSKDFRAVRLEPFTGTLGELKVQDEVTGLVLGREVTPDHWESLTPEIKDGKALLPVGNYRLISCVLSGKDARGTLISGRTDEVREDLIKIEAGTIRSLPCGLPMDLKVTCTKRGGQGRSESGSMSAARSLFGSSSPGSSLTLEMNLSIFGVGGEQYSRFLKGQSDQPARWSMVAAPRFRILDATGKVVAGGNFEFG